MKEILDQLNRDTGFRGSMIMLPDGIMVSAALGAGLEEDRLAAMVSAALTSARRGLAGAGLTGGLRTCVLRGTEGRLLFLDMGKAFLVVVAAADQEVDPQAAAIQSAIQRITNRRVA